MSNVRVVFSTDPKDKIICQSCQQLVSDCKCIPEDKVTEDRLLVVFRLEKSGRGGKTVTVMDGWPRNDAYLKALTKELKAKCGVGGTYTVGMKAGLIEIQGDKREALKKILSQKGIKYKGM